MTLRVQFAGRLHLSTVAVLAITISAFPAAIDLNRTDLGGNASRQCHPRIVFSIR